MHSSNQSDWAHLPGHIGRRIRFKQLQQRLQATVTTSKSTKEIVYFMMSPYTIPYSNAQVLLPHCSQWKLRPCYKRCHALVHKQIPSAAAAWLCMGQARATGLIYQVILAGASGSSSCSSACRLPLRHAQSQDFICICHRSPAMSVCHRSS